MAQLKTRITTNMTTRMTTRSLLAALVLATVAIGMSGCASKTSRQWAQTSAVISSEPQDTMVQMGAQGG